MMRFTGIALSNKIKTHQVKHTVHFFLPTVRVMRILQTTVLRELSGLYCTVLGS